ncbi:MAG: transporter [Cypionkella sp.]|uniref:ATP-binding cassette domain-containing protein n=1 Tax=Cypionkella sp. TaxID=2811411 RepID=UPI00263767A5|nr:ATP-binding cassette domain-containing protein [Cypionkella sp.]MDB5658191.1 transporter [Cypionkella sp.]
MQDMAVVVDDSNAMDAQPNAALPGSVILRLSGISKFYARIPALTDVSVDFNAGEVHAILGENGAGKSTLMNIIAGVIRPQIGTIEFDGRIVSNLSPETAAALGIAISYQHPAILDDLSVLENLRVSLPPSLFAGKSPRAVAQAILDQVGLTVPLHARSDILTVAQKQLLEIGKALAIKPKVLILDEPTASLDQDATNLLFRCVREVAKAGTSVIYITHRLAELRQIAQRVTVLRDGRKRGSALVAEVSDQDLLAMIVGRRMGSAFPPKADGVGGINFAVGSLSGQNFSDVSFDVARGQILGIAGVAGNGQSELMRALAGLQPSKGEVRLSGQALSPHHLVHNAAFMPSDRHAEGLATGLTIRENAAISALDKFSSFGIVKRKAEMEHVSDAFRSLAVKAPSMEAAVKSLSGGNQQKVVMARASLSDPGLIIADEPTQGVDVGARAEIYRILREVSAKGIPVVVNSSDAAELEGLCDKVIVMSRGRVVETLVGADVAEDRIVAAAVGALTHVDREDNRNYNASASGWRHFVQTDNATAVPLTLVMILLALFVFTQNSHYLSSFNIGNILMLATALGFIALGQTVALILGGIDLSVGPLAGFLVVVASFFVNDGQAPSVILLGFALMFGLAIVVGLVNGLLIRFASFTPIAATLAMYIGLQGCSFILRDSPGGYINAAVVEWITWQIGPIPVAFAVLVLIALAAEHGLRNQRWGWQLRATGSNEDSARRIGLRIDRTFVAGYVASALFTVLGAIMLMAQIGVGDPAQGANYTLASITAVVLGGTSLRGGRGTFVGSVLGALLLTEVLNAVSFLGLSQTYQYVFQGALILMAALIYSTVRERAAAPH